MVEEEDLMTIEEVFRTIIIKIKIFKIEIQVRISGKTIKTEIFKIIIVINKDLIEILTTTTMVVEIIIIVILIGQIIQEINLITINRLILEIRYLKMVFKITKMDLIIKVKIKVRDTEIKIQDTIIRIIKGQIRVLIIKIDNNLQDLIIKVRVRILIIHKIYQILTIKNKIRDLETKTTAQAIS